MRLLYLIFVRVCGWLVLRIQRRPVLGGLINEYERAAQKPKIRTGGRVLEPHSRRNAATSARSASISAACSAINASSSAFRAARSSYDG